MPRFALTCTGTSPLLMHSARLVDPLDSIVKQIKEYSSKTKKTDDDHEMVGKLEWMGGMYYDQTVGPFIPAPNLQKSIVEAARLSKGGKKIERGVLIETMMIPVDDYDGPREITAMYEDKRFVHRAPVKVGMNRVMRTRPVFPTWTITCTGMYDPAVINYADLEAAAVTAGNMIGLGDNRPTYGRFITKMEEMD